jgi:hypothetical protein
MKRSEVQVLLGPPGSLELSEDSENGDLAQLVEHLLCKQGVRGSTPLVSTVKKLPLEIGGVFYLFGESVRFLD